ncbi:DUF2637 domain-containing protein [Streptomyces profundus]|uniref:DUF2637 domain-containing protein n=1 Tax=Streptomyces profundus TaxID=2867410 RepID=UPI001D16536D|nr:DUF2637 domain-containing protein [Streptomyces sp. MA3_2.13]UED84930.1 DUF2637 domain-containing protein [Streptomyces sp. MA3_2.13]
MAAIKLTRAHRILVSIVLAGAVVIATIGFVGSYAAVRDLAERKGFGDFAPFFPIGVDAGIVVLLSLDLLLTWLRIPFPLLRQSAWLLTAATIAFNGASAWGDPLGVGMHAIIPVLFVITVEAARHAIGRVADITADRHMEGVRMWRWVLSPIPTFRLWRRMKLWELRSYQEVIGMERDRLVYQAQLRAEYGRAWRRRAPVEARMPLKLARYGVPLRDTAATGLAAARLPLAVERREDAPGEAAGEEAGRRPAERGARGESANPEHAPRPGVVRETEQRTPLEYAPPAAPTTPTTPAEPPAAERLPEREAWTAPEAAEQEPAYAEPAYRDLDDLVGAAAPAGPLASQEAAVTVPVAPGRRRALGNAPSAPAEPSPDRAPDGAPGSEPLYSAYRQYILEQGEFPNARQLSRFLHERFAITDSDGTLLSEQYLRPFTRGFRERYNAEMGTGV